MMDRQVAIKVISPDFVQDSRARGWFRREVLASTQLNHPNVVLAHDADELDGVLFLVMEYVDGPNLDAYVKQHGAMPFRLACEMMRQAAVALQHAHEKGMVHRDIKPANLLLPLGALPPATLAQQMVASTTGQTPVLVKVADFGLARLHHQAPAGTLMLQSEKSFLGTPDYVSPEQARNLHAVDIRSDLYSLGCTFYYALSARAPFRGTTVLEVVVQHLERQPEPLRMHVPGVPEALDEILNRLLAKDPESRFQSPEDLIAALSPLCTPEPLASAEAPATPDTPNLEKWTPGIKPAGAATAGTATAVVAQLAFWDGPVLSQKRSALQPVLKPAPKADPGKRTPAEPDSVPCPVESAASCAPPGVALAKDRSATFSERPHRPTAELRESWRQWLSVLEVLVRGKNVRVNELAYQSLHRTILAQCRSSGAGDTGCPVVLRCLETLVAPWLTTQTLAGIDRETLVSLHHQCLQLNEELFGPTRASRWPAFAVAAALAAALLIGWYLSGSEELNSVVEDSTDAIWTAVRHRPLLSMSVAIPIMLVGTLGFLSRLLRA
jgi:serine/threonine protein kinase